jgi:hypothetical protein
MSIARRPILLMPIAFAGVLIFPCAFVDRAAASEFSAPVARALEAARCATLSPRFEPPAFHSLSPEPVSVRTPGGAELRSLVGEPCPSHPHPRDA